MQDCIFCKIVNKEIPKEFVWEDAKFVAFLDVNPLNPGHLLIVPKKHEGYIFNIEDPEYCELFQAAKLLAEPLQKVTGALRIGLVVEGFGVDHVHVHLIPINKAHELDPNRAYKASEEELHSMTKKIKAEL